MSIKTKKKQFNPELLNETQVQKIDIGAKRGLIQIKKTISFEWSRNAMKFFAMILTSLFIYALFLTIEIITENRSGEPPTDPAAYFQNFLTMIDLLVIIISATFFGSIIAEDFEKETGNLLFPKIPKERLLIGRFLARYIYAFLTIAFYYSIVAITTLIKLDGVPKVVWGSMLWAEFYLLGVAAFFTLLSSIMKRSSTAMITGILGVLMVFELISMILMFTGVEVEPLFILTYYSNIITAWFDMPENRFVELNFNRGPGAVNDNTYFQWISPSAQGAALGLILYTGILLAFGYYLYKKKQA